MQANRSPAQLICDSGIRRCAEPRSDTRRFPLPDGLVFLNAGYEAIAWNPATMGETILPNLPRAVAVYPASGVSAMLPMTPANNYTASILICGGVEQPNTDAVWSVAGHRLALTAQGQCPRQRHSLPELAVVLAHGLPRRRFDVDSG